MKHIHTEGPGSILKSRFARGVFPLVAALLACAYTSAHAAAAVKPGSPFKIDTSSSAGAAAKNVPLSMAAENTKPSL